MQIPRHRSLLTALTCAVALVMAACAGDADDPAAAPTADESLPPAEGDAGHAGGAAGGTTMRVYSVTEAKSAEVEGSIHVVGLLIEDGSGWRLCEVAMESYPPQCGGERLTVEGLDPSGLPIEESGEVRWQTEATVVGEIDGDTLTVTGSPASA